METFVNLEAWRSGALLLNLVTFFLAFSAFSVGMLISVRIRRLLSSGLLNGVVTSFLMASAALSVRSLAIILFHLGLVPQMAAVILSDLSLVVVGGALFWAYVVFERFLKTKEAA
ncbi:MAG TPA: hypothetical protein V6D05_00520 [Stenomitos sp.]